LSGESRLKDGAESAIRGGEYRATHTQRPQPSGIDKMANDAAPQYFPRSAEITVLVISIISGFIPTLQGLLLPQLVSEGRLTLAALGQVAMAEAIGTLIALASANAFLKPKRLRWVTASAALLGMAIDLATPHLNGSEIAAARLVHGLCAGLLAWIWIGFLTRTQNPGRWVGLFFAVESATVMLLSYWFNSVLVPWGGSTAGYAVVATLYGTLFLLARWVPAQFTQLLQNGGSIMPDLKGWIGLGVVFCQVGAIIAMWIYLKPQGQHAGFSDAVIGLAMTLALGSQIFAGIFSAAIAGRVNSRIVLIVVAALSAASIITLNLPGISNPIFTVAVILFAFLWAFAPPFQMMYLIEIDHSRRAAMHISTASLVGVVVGPALASFAVSQNGIIGALWVAVGLYGLTALAVIFNHPTRAMPAATA
jgi:DHA1 family inner membrane transport protein